MKRTWKDWAIATILALCLSFTVSPARADEISDAASKAGIGAEGERIQRCIRHYESTDGLNGNKGNGGGDYQYAKGKPADQHGETAQHIKDGTYKRMWAAQAGRCWGGGGGGGAQRTVRSAPVRVCIDHAEWQSGQWSLVKTAQACGHEPPDWATTPQVWARGCGWHGELWACDPIEGKATL